MTQTMRDMVEATVMQCVNTYQEYSEYPLFDSYYHETMFEILCEELKKTQSGCIFTKKATVYKGSDNLSEMENVLFIAIF